MNSKAASARVSAETTSLNFEIGEFCPRFTMDLLFQIEHALNLKDDLTWTRGKLGGSLIVMGSTVKTETGEGRVLRVSAW